MRQPKSWDIFCNVVDNFGDIGVAWRLARILAGEHGLQVRLWVDDLESFNRLCPEADRSLDRQRCSGVEVLRWAAPFAAAEPAEVVIEAFGCKLPENYLEAMAKLRVAPVWINLEYLSAEDWVAGCHGLPSPHPKLPLVKYFFFPGFTRDTGGLLCEKDLLLRRDRFLRDPLQKQQFMQQLGVSPKPGAICSSLFCYENPMLPELFESWAQSEQPMLCLVPEGRILPQVAAFFGAKSLWPGDLQRLGNLEVKVLPFVEQSRYDQLLWVSDLNFVRGEDSCVRAQWAGKPFVWHIYPQQQGVHFEKLQAFLNLYQAGLSNEAYVALSRFWEAWNQGVGAARAWRDLVGLLPALEAHARRWTEKLSGNELAWNLMKFCEKRFNMSGFEFQGGKS